MTIRLLQEFAAEIFLEVHEPELELVGERPNDLVKETNVWWKNLLPDEANFLCRRTSIWAYSHRKNHLLVVHPLMQARFTLTQLALL